MKVKDGICGVIIGDALGVPVEFVPKNELDENPVTDLKGYGTYNQPPGTWSDDSSMTIATIYSIVNKKTVDYNDIMEKFSEWLNYGRFTQYKNTFDYGNTTYNSIKEFDYGKEALECGGKGERANGNGSLMRILPLCFIDEISYEVIENISALTHAHMRSKIACVLYIEIAKSILENDLSIGEHVETACSKIKKYYADSDELKHFSNIFNDNFNNVKSSGYVIDTLECAIYCLKTTNDFNSAVLKAVNFGRDTDTVGAVCGGLAGLYYGFDMICPKWIENIPKLNEVINLCEEYEKIIPQLDYP